MLFLPVFNFFHLKTLAVVKKIATAQQLKEEGNEFVKQQNYPRALFAYHKV